MPQTGGRDRLRYCHLAMIMMEIRTLDHFVLIYEKYAASENKSQRTIEGVRNAVRIFGDFLGQNTDPANIKSEDLVNYKLYLKTRTKWSQVPSKKKQYGYLTPASIASYVRSIRSFFSWMEGEEFISANPFTRIKPPNVPMKIVDPLVPQDVSQLLKFMSRKSYRGFRDSCVILTLYGTAMRISEAFDLKTTDVDFNSGEIKVMGKGAKQRNLYMSPTLFKALYKYQSQWRPKVASEYFFVHESGGKLDRFYFEHRLKLYVKQSGITKRCTPHSFRYGCAIQLIRNGVDPFTVQAILGHATLEMTRHYVRLANSDVEKKMKSSSPAEQITIKF